MSLLILVTLLSVSSDFERCLAGVDHNALANNQLLECATTSMDRADTALNARYRQVMRALSPTRQARLRADERRWIAMRRRRCLAAARNPIPTPEINRMRCLADETDRRTAALSRFR